MKMKRVLAAALIAAMALTGCAGAGQSEQPAAEAPAVDGAQQDDAQPEPQEAEVQEADNTGSVILKVAGSTSVAPLMKELKAAYEAVHSNVSVEIQESGSSAGITAAIEGAADIGMSSRDLKDSEIEEGLEEIVIALDGIAVVVHPDNPVADLTKEQITQIYTGEIANWSDVGGNDGAIIVVSREEGSGTRGAFEELMDLEQDVERDGETYKESIISQDAIFENSTGGVKSNVASSKNAIGYISLGSLDDTVSALAVGGVQCSVDNVKSGDYVVSRPFLLCTKGAASADAQDLIDFILSEEGQSIVVENSYISVD